MLNWTLSRRQRKVRRILVAAKYVLGLVLLVLEIVQRLLSLLQ